MKCPHCKTEFPLTWTRYAKAPTGKHICPSCHGTAKLRITPSYFLCLLFPLGIVTCGLTVALLIISGGQWDTVLYLAGMMLAVGFPLDKWYTEHFRKLEPTAAKQEA